MAAFLKLVGTGRIPAPEPYTKTYVDFSPRRNPKGKIQIDDYLVLYAAGGRKCVFAVARVASEPYSSGNNEWPYRLNVNYLVNVSAADGVPLHKINVNRDIQKCIRGSYFRLTPEEFSQAVALLKEAD